MSQCFFDRLARRIWRQPVAFQNAQVRRDVHAAVEACNRLDESQRVREQALVGGASGRQAEALAGTVPVPWSLAELPKEWNRAEHTAAPWWAANSKEAYHSGLDALARALDGWSKSGRGNARGARLVSPDPRSWGRDDRFGLPPVRSE